MNSLFFSQQSNLTCHTTDILGSQLCGYHCPAANVDPPSMEQSGHRYILNDAQSTLTISVFGQNSTDNYYREMREQYQPAMWCNWFVDAPVNRTIAVQLMFIITDSFNDFVHLYDSVCFICR